MAADVTDREWLLGLPVDIVDRAAADSEIHRLVSEGQPSLVITADASAIIFARRDPEFQEIFKSASLVTPDGAGVVLGLRMLGRQVRERVCGVDLVVDIAAQAEREGWKVFLLGAEPGVADAAAQELKTRFPNLQICGVQHGYFQDDAPVVDAIRDSGAQVLLIAMGMPRQEKWFWRYRDQLGVSVAMGVGGSFDVLSGRVRRAPGFFQRYNLEWLYRFWCAPRKSSRKLMVLPVFAGLAMLEARRRRSRRKG